MRFSDLPLQEKLQKTLTKNRFLELTPIQKTCIPEILKGNDIVGQAETGSGKTLAFCLPLLHMIDPTQKVQVLVLTPTRELCVQVSSVFKDFGKNLGIKTIEIYGGVSISPQIKDIPKAHIIVATPGRLLDHVNRKTIDISKIRFLILDETDKMLDMGFIDDVERIISKCSKKRQTLMFSATVSDEVYRIAKRHQKHSQIKKTKSMVDTDKLSQKYYDIHHHQDKFSLLVHLLKNETSGLAIVFCATRKETDILAKNLRRQGINASEIHGGMTQNKRLRSLDNLKKENIDVLVATDVAARGLDIKNVSHVYNYDVPGTPKDYIHRIGRTARAGKNGDAITLLTRRDHDNFRRVQSNDKLLIRKARFPQFNKVQFIRNKTKRAKGSWKNSQRKR